MIRLQMRRLILVFVGHITQKVCVLTLRLNELLYHLFIATDKRGYPRNIFLISRRKHVVGTH